jgi:hypothetical protein
VQAHPQGVVALEYAGQGRRDAHWLHDRLFAADSYELHVRDLAQALQDVLEPVIVQAQWIAAGDEHVAHDWRLLDVVECCLDIRFLHTAFADRADHASTRAVATVDRAEVGHEKQYPVGVAVHQSRYRAVSVFPEWVVILAAGDKILAKHGHHGTAKWLQRVCSIQQAGIVRRDADGQGAGMLPDRRGLVLGQVDHPLQVGQRAHPVPVLPAPVVPVVNAGFRIVSGQELRRAL